MYGKSTKDIKSKITHSEVAVNENNKLLHQRIQIRRLEKTM